LPTAAVRRLVTGVSQGVSSRMPEGASRSRRRSRAGPGPGWPQYAAGRPRRGLVRAGAGASARSARQGDGPELVLDPPAGHDTQGQAELRPQPGFHGGQVSGGHHQDCLVPGGPEQGDRDGRAGLCQVADVIVQLHIAAARHSRPATRRCRARRRHPAGTRHRRRGRGQSAALPGADRPTRCRLPWPGPAPARRLPPGEPGHRSQRWSREPRYA